MFTSDVNGAKRLAELAAKEHWPTPIICDLLRKFVEEERDQYESDMEHRYDFEYGPIESYASTVAFLTTWSEKAAFPKIFNAKGRQEILGFVEGLDEVPQKELCHVALGWVLALNKKGPTAAICRAFGWGFESDDK